MQQETVLAVTFRQETRHARNARRTVALVVLDCILNEMRFAL